MSKERLTVTVDPDVVRAGNQAVADGQVESLSAWVNLALTERAVKDRRLRALAEAVADYEQAFGAISDEELARQRHADRAAARVVRPAAPRVPRPRRSRRRGVA